LAAIIAAHFVIGLLYLWATPMFEASDEGAHYGVIEWLKRGNGLPLQTPGEAAKKTIYHQEGSQPPLYYVLSAALTAWLPTSDFEQVFVQNPHSEVGYVGAAHNANLYRPAPPTASGETQRVVTAIRLFSLVLSCVTLALAYVLARQIFVDEARALLATALVAFNPMALFINASVNNDNLLMLLTTSTLLMTLGLVQARTRPSALKLIGLGALCGVAALTKLSGLVLWPVVALALIAEQWGHVPRAERNVRSALRHLTPVFIRGLIIFGVALLVCGWWYARNIVLYGDVTGLNAMIAIAGPRTVTPSQLLAEWYGFYLSFWGVFGAFTVLPGVWAQWLFHALTVATILGLGVALWRRRGRVSFPIFLLGLFCALTFAGVLRWTMQTPASQGRLLFGAIAPLSLGLATGLLAFFRSPASLGERRFAYGVRAHSLSSQARVGERAHSLSPRERVGVRAHSLSPWERVGVRASHAAFALGAALAAAAALIPVLDIAPQYAPPPDVAESELPADLRPVRAVLGDGLELIGYTTDDSPRRPGEVQPVTLYWRATQPLPRDDALALILFGRDNAGLGVIDTWPGRGRLPLTQIQPGVIYADTITLPIAAEAVTPTLLRLRLGLWRAGPEDRLPIQLPDGAQTDTLTLPVGRLSAAQPPPAPTITDSSTFEYGIELIGYAARANGDTLTLTLNWRARERVPADYTLFVHLVDAAGVQVDQADGPPLNGDWPTSAWLPGETFAETRTLTLPASAAPECCSVRLGWYDAATGRLAAFQPDGEPWPDNAVVLKVK
jgi:hypothetical protein